jgi:hypothetical protein
MHEERTPPNLTLRVGLAATVGVLAQILLVAIPANGRPKDILATFVLLPPSVVPTLCVIWALRRSRVLFPGMHGVPISLAIGSWHVTAILAGLLLSIVGLRLEHVGLPLVMSIVGTVPIAVAVWRLARWWDWGHAFWMLGVGAAVGAVGTLTSERAAPMLVVTVLWTAAIGLVAGRWLARATVLLEEGAAVR